MRFFLSLSSLLPALLLSACATSPQVTSDAERGITPTESLSLELSESATPLQWGGVIVETRNLSEATELQVLAYPLSNSGRPEVSDSPSGRFIVQNPGYLEAVDYRKGRQVTATGRLIEKRDGQVGEAAYTFPVLLADELVLWPEESTRKASPRVNFGLGVGSGGRSWGGVGIGIGF